MGAIRYDVVVLQSGMRVATVRARLQDVDVAADPVVLIRRQGIGAFSYHRVGAEGLAARLAEASDEQRLSDLIELDAGNEVPLHELDELDGDQPPYGLVVLGRTVIGFSEGVFAGADDLPRRGSGAVPPEPPRAAPPVTSTDAPPPMRTAEPPPAEPTAPPRDSPPPVPAGAPAPAEPTEPFSAFPHIDAPITVEPDEAFAVEVTLAPRPARHTSGGAIVVDELTPEDEEADELTFHVLVTGPFTVAPGFDNAGELRVRRATLQGEPFEVELIPSEPPESYDPLVGVWTARITASFHYDGAFVGEAHREIRVNQMRARSRARESERRPPVAEVSRLVVGDEAPPDLTITLRREGNPAVSTYRMELSSPHLPVPTDAGPVELGSDARAFAAQVIRDIDKTIANRVSDETVQSFGLILRDKMPDVLFTVLEHVWRTVNGPDVPAGPRRVPDVLLLTDDWMVPWELLMVDLDPERPHFLGAQVNLGRWPLEHLDKLAATPLGLTGLGVMIGYYKDARGVAPLQRAEEEGAALVQTYEARAVNADDEAFDQLLAGQLADGFAFQALHFAGHGQSDPDRGTYLMYSNGAQMSVMPFRSARIARENDAFLFVNACQVGTADEMLGGYAGLAGLAIAGGFRGFVAPLWSVADDLAQTISLGLYEGSTSGLPVAAYLRDVRAHFRQTDDAPAHTTYLAYTYYGHPRLVLGGPRTREDRG